MRQMPLQTLNSPEWQLRDALIVQVEEGETCVATYGPFQGTGETPPMAVADLADQIVGAASVGDAAARALIAWKPDPAAVVVPQVSLPKPQGRVYVLLDVEGKVKGVTSEEPWAQRWERWAAGTVVPLTVDELP